MVMATIDYDGGESDSSSQYSDEVDEETWAATTVTSRTDTEADIGDGTVEVTSADPSPSSPPSSSSSSPPELPLELSPVVVVLVLFLLGAAYVGEFGG